MAGQKSLEGRQAMSKQETTPCAKIVLRIGITSVILATVYAIGSLGYYGLGYSLQTSALDNLKSGAWPEDVKHKIQACYVYLFFSYYICVITACLVFCHAMLFRIFSSTPMVIVDFLVQTLMQNGKTLATLQSEGIFSTQRIIWVLYCMFVGAIASPVFLPGMKTAKVATHLTGLIVTCLTLYSFVLPVGVIVPWRKNLSMCEIAIFIASLGGALFPVTSTLGAFFFTIAFYGGLIFYPVNFLLHSQDAQMLASESSTEENGYCSMAMAIPMLLDVISIFGRIVVLILPRAGHD